MGQHVADDRTPEAIYNIHRHPCSHHCVGISCQVVQGNEATVYVDDKIDITPTQVLAMKEIGEWEFLSIENEEMIDTVRKGFFKDDELIRIYYGTLRLGFDMSEAKADWIKADKDTLVITLPKIKLLDENFIDEARTKSFFESAHGATRTGPTCISAPMQK